MEYCGDRLDPCSVARGNFGLRDILSVVNEKGRFLQAIPKINFDGILIETDRVEEVDERDVRIDGTQRS